LASYGRKRREKNRLEKKSFPGREVGGRKGERKI